MTAAQNNEMNGSQQFFEQNYQLLRDQPSMKWMGRLFAALTTNSYPKLIDLPTGAGKTDVVLVWILALSWHGSKRGSTTPIPRRLVWVVNRRVLVQQVFRLADRLQEKLVDGSDRALTDLRAGLASLSGTPDDIFRVVQLRGQLVDDREWSVVPTVPQLIIGTVDQIGSRLLFQGYNLGKWSRPLQAALSAIDAWICVDEAHLAPAFVLTLRQLPVFAATTGNDLPEAISSLFGRLPLWVTELSATPALPPPGSVFGLVQEDECDPQLRDRLLAARTRVVRIRWVPKEQKVEEAIQKGAADLASTAKTVAIFVRKAAEANKIGKKLESQFRGRSLTITGRIRGYERDRLGANEIFRHFGPDEHSDASEPAKPAFLIGTAAAEVGLDADAEVIVCDFASLPTLLQRLGRLDRRGRASRAFHAGEGEAPTMTIFAHTPQNVGPNTQARTRELAKALSEDEASISASLLVGKHWREALKKATNEDASEADEKKQSIDENTLISAATWEVLLGTNSGTEGDADDPETSATAKSDVANPPATWLKHAHSCVTGGPVSVPPLTLPLIEHWSGTTKPRNDFLPVHPFLYGILPDEEGTPLVGIAFRLEMDVLAAATSTEEEEADDDEADGRVGVSQIEEIFRLFPPRRAEFHFVPISNARKWFSSEEASAVPVAHFDGDEWSATPDRDDSSQIRPGSILVLPTLAGSHESLKEIIEDDSNIKDFSRDVLEGVSTKRPSYWRRIVQVTRGEYRLDSNEGASRIERREEATESSAAPERSLLGDTLPGPTWEPRLKRSLKIGGSTFRFEYLKPKRPVQRQLLDDSDGSPGHLTRAQTDANRIAEALAPGDRFLKSLLVETAKVHDEGKRNCKWQRAMGNPDCANPVAKPLVERPAPMGGFRHEWESLLMMRGYSPKTPASLSASDSSRWVDLWQHLIVSHHGHLRPWISDNGFAPEIGKQQQSALRAGAAERFALLQRLLGPWRLAYLEALIKAADVASSQPDDEEDDEQ